MKKIYSLLLIAFLMLTVSLEAQTFQKGDLGLNVGIGLGYRGFPIEVSATYGIVDDLFNVDGLTMSVGGYLGLSFFAGTEFYNWTWHTYAGTRILPAVRVLAHYTFFDKLEVFAGPALGVTLNRSSSFFGYDEGFNVYGSIAAGAKYYFTENFGVYAETGYSIGYFMVGATFKF